ncbi:unnamed protein product, partial [marine sediment metagenome]
KALFVSAVTGEGIPELMAETMNMLQSAAGTKAGGKILRKVFHPQPRGVAPRVHKEGDTFVVTAPELERLVARTGVVSYGVRRELRRQFARLGSKVPPNTPIFILLPFPFKIATANSIPQ